jgi:hypothetical protein
VARDVLVMTVGRDSTTYSMCLFRRQKKCKIALVNSEWCCLSIKASFDYDYAFVAHN